MKIKRFKEYSKINEYLSNDELENDLKVDDDLFEMSNFKGSNLGLDDNIVLWMGSVLSSKHKHGNRIKVSNIPGKSMGTSHDCFEITIPDLKIIGEVNKNHITNKKLQKIFTFIKINEKLIIDFCQEKIDSFEFISKLKKYSENATYTMYSGVSLKAWNDIWKNKNLKNRETNVTSDIEFAKDYSYDFETGKYDDIVVEISNIPLEAFISYREDDYEDDDDYISMVNLDDKTKNQIIKNNSLFIVNLYDYKEIIKVKLLE